MTTTRTHRLDGLEPDNPLSFLALLGLLRALEASDRARPANERLLPRAAWDVDSPPVRPVLSISREAAREEITDLASAGIELLSAAHDFDGEKNLSYTKNDSRQMLASESRAATHKSRNRADLLAALMTDGHQHFLDRLSEVPRQHAPPPRGRGKARIRITAAECLAEALFEPWHRSDPTFSFRWDPEEDVRYALMGGDPTDPAYQSGTQHGANRLAAVGVGALTVVPSRSARYPLAVLGGEFRNGFSFAWPMWREPASLVAIRALLAHPGLREPGRLDYLGVDHVLVSRRISVGKFMNFSRGRPIVSEPSAPERSAGR